MWVPSLGQEDPLEEEMVSHSSILAWRIPQTRGSLMGYSQGSQKVRHDRASENTLIKENIPLFSASKMCKSETDS